MKLILLVILSALMHAALTFADGAVVESAAAGTILATGFLLLAATLCGDLFKDIKLPKLTGYLCLGIVAGPHLLNLVTDEMLGNLRIFNGVAIALIALTAGLELDFAELRPLFSTILWIALLAVVGTMIVLTGTVYFMRPWLPFGQDLTSFQFLSISLVVAVVLSSQSPAVVVALRNETQAEGPMIRTVLGTVVLCDLLVLTSFAIASSLAEAAVGGSADAFATLGDLAWELLGSAVVGVLMGGLIGLFFRYGRGGGGAMFLVMIGFVIAEVGQRVHFDPLLIALCAGILIRNFTFMGDKLLAELEAGSLPIYVAFFAVTGAAIHLDALAYLGVPAVILVLVRATSRILGARAATAIASAPETVKKYAGFGILPQAGLALALTLLFARTFPDMGGEAATLLFAVVAMNEIVAPVLLRWAIVQAGELGGQTRTREEPAEATLASSPATP